MSQDTIQAPADADGTFYCDTGPYPFVTFSSPLTSTDTVQIYVNLPDGVDVEAALMRAPDVNGVITGLDATNPSRVYIGGPVYVLIRSNHASEVGIYADYGSRRV